jgi:hypothetical protein
MQPDRICPTFRAAAPRLAPQSPPRLVPLTTVAAGAVA